MSFPEVLIQLNGWFSSLESLPIVKLYIRVRGDHIMTGFYITLITSENTYASLAFCFQSVIEWTSMILGQWHTDFQSVDRF